MKDFTYLKAIQKLDTYKLYLEGKCSQHIYNPTSKSKLYYDRRDRRRIYSFCANCKSKISPNYPLEEFTTQELFTISIL